MYAMRLRDKSSKARELAVQLNELRIPHQEAMDPWLSRTCKCHSLPFRFHTMSLHAQAMAENLKEDHKLLQHVAERTLHAHTLKLTLLPMTLS